VFDFGNSLVFTVLGAIWWDQQSHVAQSFTLIFLCYHFSSWKHICHWMALTLFLYQSDM